MSDNIRGTVQAVGKPRPNSFKPNAAPYQSFKVNEVWYSNGTKVPPEAGALVEFAAEQNDKGFWNVSKAGIRVVQPGTPVSGSIGAAVSNTAKSANLGKEGYWDRKDQRDVEWQSYQRTVVQPKIELQAARNAAIEFVKLLLTENTYGDKGERGPALKLGANISKREQVLFEAVKKYTQEFVQANISENNNKNEQPPQVEASSPKDSESVATDDSAWAV